MELGTWIRNPDLPTNDLVGDSGSHFGGVAWINGGSLYVSHSVNNSNVPFRNQMWSAPLLGSGRVGDWTVYNPDQGVAPARWRTFPTSQTRWFWSDSSYVYDDSVFGSWAQNTSGGAEPERRHVFRWYTPSTYALVSEKPYHTTTIFAYPIGNDRFVWSGNGVFIDLLQNKNLVPQYINGAAPEATFTYSRGCATERIVYRLTGSNAGAGGNIWAWDTKTNTVRLAGRPPTTTQYCNKPLIYRDWFIIVGGGRGTGANYNIYATKITDQTTGELSNQWQNLGSIPVESYWHGCNIDSAGFLHIVAGIGSANQKILNAATYSVQIIS